jgi:hypothetical protein
MFGYDPEVDIEKGIGLYIDWFKSQNYDIANLLKQQTIFNW